MLSFLPAINNVLAFAFSTLILDLDQIKWRIKILVTMAFCSHALLRGKTFATIT